MTDNEKQKLTEEIRFQIERILWKVEIDHKAKIQSFSVVMEKGSVKSVRLKVEP